MLVKAPPSVEQPVIQKVAYAEKVLATSEDKKGEYTITQNWLKFSERVKETNLNVNEEGVEATIALAPGWQIRFDNDAVCGTFFNYRGKGGKMKKAAVIVFANKDVMLYVEEKESVPGYTYKKRFSAGNDCTIEVERDKKRNFVFSIIGASGNEAAYAMPERKL
jgi:hypothetical protein